MKYNLKNPIWQEDPDYAKLCFEQELREILDDPRYERQLIKEILGE